MNKPIGNVSDEMPGPLPAAINQTIEALCGGLYSIERVRLCKAISDELTAAEQRSENKTLDYCIDLIDTYINGTDIADVDELYAEIEDVYGQIKHLRSGVSCNDE